MDSIFQIGDFTFRLCCPPEVTPPENFMKFESSMGTHLARTQETPEYTYNIIVSDDLPQVEGKIIAQRPDLTVFRRETEQGESLESRLIGVKGNPEYYACYREVSGNRAEVTLVRDRIAELHIDPMFTSLLALEAPSETGKTTQANLWEKYRGSRTINGDRSLLGKINGRWMAQGWPVCGTSEVCNNEAIPIKAVVMLSQAKENRAERLTPGHAFPLLYSQITVNKWNTPDHIHIMDLIEDFLGSVPVLHLGCTISEEAVTCLEKSLRELDRETLPVQDA